MVISLDHPLVCPPSSPSSPLAPPSHTAVHERRVRAVQVAARVTPGLVGAYAVKVALAAVLPTAWFALAAVALGQGWWQGLLEWWRPWSDAALFAALTTVVHEGLYFGELWTCVRGGGGLVACVPLLAGQRRPSHPTAHPIPLAGHGSLSAVNAPSVTPLGHRRERGVLGLGQVQPAAAVQNPAQRPAGT
jgi:hypothetical protein